MFKNIDELVKIMHKEKRGVKSKATIEDSKSKNEQKEDFFQ